MTQATQHKEPLLRIVKRDGIARPKAYAIRLAAVLLGRTWHFIDPGGRVRISCPGCRWVKPFRNGRAQAERDGKRFEIDRSGREFDF